MYQVPRFIVADLVELTNGRMLAWSWCVYYDASHHYKGGANSSKRWRNSFNIGLDGTIGGRQAATGRTGRMVGLQLRRATDWRTRLAQRLRYPRGDGFGNTILLTGDVNAAGFEVFWTLSTPTQRRVRMAKILYPHVYDIPRRHPQGVSGDNLSLVDSNGR